jgi:hypothetical protein
MERENARTPLLVWVTTSVLAFLGVTALGGGVEMLLFPKGNDFVPGDWLDGIPFVTSWILPGLILAVGFGVGGLVAATGMRWKLGRVRRLESATGRHWAWALTVLLGIGLLVWIGLELLFLTERSFIEALYAAVAISLIALPLTGPVRNHLSVVAQR